MRMYDVIAKKRDGGTLNHDELAFAVNGYVAGDVPDYQMSALLMAIYLRGMTDEETAMLTDVMAHSGDMVDLSAIAGIKADKHSTGGVGDKTTLVIAPIVAACGVKIAKMSGRGLGHTGGTIDKMESVPGTRTSLTQEEFFKQVNEIGISVIGQSGKIAVADKKMYALRDVTATVGCIPLIASSIMSKKLAAGSDAILLDVTMGDGAFMKDLNKELWKMGITATTQHNEVAPAQHELAPIFSTTNVATDHNQLTMETMKNVALRHGLVCLLHEKPFAGVNGSGKHNNWSISTDTGKNLLEPGKLPQENAQFLLFLAAVIKGVDEYQDLLRISVASAGNDHRLGANEAPPAIISIFLGDELTAILHAIETGTVYGGTLRVNMEIGVNVLPSFTKDTTDRNRTSPFAFTGNKFEFRSLGSQLNIACPNIMLNTIIADELEQFADELEGKEDFNGALNALIKRVIKEHKRIIFNGDGYADAWKAEAAKRGLTNLPTTVDALPHYTDEKNVKLFTKHKIYTEVEMQSRQDIILETYAKTINIEALTASDMVKRDILPAVSSYVAELASGVATKKAISDDIPCEAELDIIKRLSGLQDCAYKKLAALDNAIIGVKEVGEDPIEVATYYKDSVITAMTELRAVVDEMETLVSSDYWPYPSYGDLMFRV